MIGLPEIVLRVKPGRKYASHANYAVISGAREGSYTLINLAPIMPDVGDAIRDPTGMRHAKRKPLCSMVASPGKTF
jgi:hypothetical protein